MDNEVEIAFKMGDCEERLESEKICSKMWRDEVSQIVVALADLAGIPSEPYPGWQPCIKIIKDKLAKVTH